VWLRHDISKAINYWSYCKQYSRRSEFDYYTVQAEWRHGLIQLVCEVSLSAWRVQIPAKNGHSREAPPSPFSWPRTTWHLFGVHIPPWLHFRWSFTPLEICVIMSSGSGGMKGIISSTAAVADFCMISCRKQEEILSFNASYVLFSRTYVRAANCNQILAFSKFRRWHHCYDFASDMTTIRS